MDSHPSQRGSHARNPANGLMAVHMQYRLVTRSNLQSHPTSRARGRQGLHLCAVQPTHP